MSDNYIGEAGAAALAAALASNTSLKTLLLKGNELGDAGVIAICDALAVGEGGPRGAECYCFFCASRAASSAAMSTSHSTVSPSAIARVMRISGLPGSASTAV